MAAPGGPSSLLRRALDRKHDQVAQEDSSQAFEKFRRGRRALGNRGWLSASDGGSAFGKQVVLRFQFDFDRRPHAYELTPMQIAFEVDGDGGFESVGGFVGKGGAALPKPPPRQPFRQDSDKARRPPPDLVDGSLVLAYRFYCKVQLPHSQLARKTSALEEAGECFRALSFLGVLTFLRDFQVVPKLLIAQDVAVIWRLSKTMQLGNGVGASTDKSADGSVQLKVGKVAPKSNDVAKSSLDFSQFVHFFARCCLAAFPSLGPDQAVAKMARHLRLSDDARAKRILRSVGAVSAALINSANAAPQPSGDLAATAQGTDLNLIPPRDLHSVAQAHVERQTVQLLEAAKYRAKRVVVHKPRDKRRALEKEHSQAGRGPMGKDAREDGSSGGWGGGGGGDEDDSSGLGPIPRQMGRRVTLAAAARPRSAPSTSPGVPGRADLVRFAKAPHELASWAQRYDALTDRPLNDPPPLSKLLANAGKQTPLDLPDTDLVPHKLLKCQMEALRRFDPATTPLGLRPYIFEPRRKWESLVVPALDLGSLPTGEVHSVQMQLKNTWTDTISVTISAEGNELRHLTTFTFVAASTLVPGLKCNLLIEFDTSRRALRKAFGAHHHGAAAKPSSPAPSRRFHEVTGFLVLHLRPLDHGAPHDPHHPHLQPAPANHAAAHAASRPGSSGHAAGPAGTRPSSAAKHRAREEPDKAPSAGQAAGAGLFLSRHSSREGLGPDGRILDPDLYAAHRLPVYFQVDP